MKRILITLVVAIVTPLLAFSQAPATSSNPQQALMKIEQNLVAALVKGDASAVERNMASTCLFTGPDGGRQTKAEMVADMKTGALKMKSSKNDGMKVQVYGDAAVVTYRSTDNGTYEGRDISGQYNWMDVFTKQNDRWQIVATQGTPLSKQ